MNVALRIVFSILLVPASLAGHADEEANLRLLLDQYITSINEVDISLAEQIWSQTGQISFIHPRGHQRGWDEIKNGFYLEAMGPFAKRRLEFRDVSIHILSEDTAWAEFYWDFEAEFPDGKPLATTGRETQVLKKEADGWKIVHIHYSGPPIEEEGQGF